MQSVHIYICMNECEQRRTCLQLARPDDVTIYLFIVCLVLSPTHQVTPWVNDGTGTFRSRTFHPRTIIPYTLFPDVLTSLYVSSLNESQPTELHQPCIGWAFSLT
jgi:hypothetical protein